jgi:hypothetical protein
MIKSDFYIDFLINSTNFMINSVDFSEIRPDHPIKFQQFSKKTATFFNPGHTCLSRPLPFPSRPIGHTKREEATYSKKQKQN